MRKVITLVSILIAAFSALGVYVITDGYGKYLDAHPVPPASHCRPPANALIADWQPPADCSFDRSFGAYLKSLELP